MSGCFVWLVDFRNREVGTYGLRMELLAQARKKKYERSEGGRDEGYYEAKEKPQQSNKLEISLPLESSDLLSITSRPFGLVGRFLSLLVVY